jgi:prophage antirepressor-like protein
MPSTDLQVFTYPATQAPIRLARVDDDGTPWFVAKDVCDVLGIVNVSRALDGLDEDERGLHTVKTPSFPQEMAIVSEPGLYGLVLKSRKPEAKAFKRWLKHDVLPSIRKTGGYGQTTALTPATSDVAALVTVVTKLVDRLDLQLAPPSHAIIPQDRQDRFVRRARFLNNGSAQSCWRRVCDRMGYSRSVRMFSVVTEGDLEQVDALVEGHAPQETALTKRQLPAPKPTTQPVPLQTHTVGGELKATPSGHPSARRMTREQLLGKLQKEVNRAIDDSTLDSLIRLAGVGETPWVAVNGMYEDSWDRDGYDWLVKTYRERPDNIGRSVPFDPEAPAPHVEH